MGVSILSEALCKVYPDHFSIKNKRSEWALYFILSNAGPDYIENKLSGSPRYRFIESSDVEGENLYTALGQTEAGRYLTVYFVHKKTGEALIISARDMTRKERRAYGR